MKIGDFGLSKIADSPEPMLLDPERALKPMTSFHDMMGAMTSSFISLYVSMCIYTYIYIYVCVWHICDICHYIIYLYFSDCLFLSTGDHDPQLTTGIVR